MVDPAVLIQRWQGGDEQAAEAIYNHFRGAAFGLAYALLDDPTDAEEVAQDALTYALTHIDRYDPRRAKFSTWLHTITVSRCRNKRRRKTLTSLSLLVWRSRGGDAVDPAPGPERQTIQTQQRDEVWQAIQTLNQPLKEAILLRHWTDYSYQEISDILNCPMRTVQSRVRLAYRQLEKKLSQSNLADIKEKI